MAPVPTISVKWFHDGTFRRFGLEVPEKGDLFAALMTKIQNLFAEFNQALAWKDQDGDLIVFSSDAELREAVHTAVRATGELLRIYTVERDGQGMPFVRQNSQSQASTDGQEKPKEQQQEGPEHVGVVCDACDQGIHGVRYKCLGCTDYDLCAACERKGVHNEHSMVRISDPHDHSWRWCFMMNRRGGRGRWGHGGGGRCHGTGRGRGPWWMMGGPPPFCAQGTEQKEKTTEGAQAASADDGQQNSSDQFAQAGVNFLREVGETVAAALGNLGIDVDVDVEHEGQREKVATPDKKGKEAEPMDENATVDQTAAQETVPKEVEASQQHDWTLLGDAPTEQPRIIPITIDTPPPPTAPLAPQMMSAAPLAPQMFGAPLAPQPTPNLYPMATIASRVPTTSITHPDPQVNKTINDLIAMGFTNEGGWLTALVEQKNGDINAALNSLHPRNH